MRNKRYGIWFVGAYGGVATTAALGIACLKRGLTPATGLVTELDLFQGLELASFDQFVIGGHDVRRAGFLASAQELAAKSGVFSESVMKACSHQFAEWEENICAGTVRGAGKTVAKLSSWNGTGASGTANDVIDRLGLDMEA